MVTVFRRFSQSVRISFHLSLRLLLRYRPRRVFRFGRVALPFSRGNSDPRYSVPDRPRTLSSTGLSPCIAVLSRRIRLFVQGSASGTTSPGAFARGFGSTCSGFGRPYFRNHICFLFLPVRRCFTSGRSPSALKDGMRDRVGVVREVPLGDRRIDGFMHLPAVFRSLSRPSSTSEPRHPTVT